MNHTNCSFLNDDLIFDFVLFVLYNNIDLNSRRSIAFFLYSRIILYNLCNVYFENSWSFNRFNNSS